MLNLSYSFSPRLKKTIDDIDLLRTKLLVTPISPKDELVFRWETMIDRLHSLPTTTQEPITKTEIANLLSTYNPKKTTTKEQELINYKKALDFLHHTWIASKSKVTSEEILALYNIACAPTLGRVLNFENFIVQLEEFLKYLQAGQEIPVIQSGLAFIKLLKDPVFRQGNERVAILTSYLFLYKHGYDMRGFLVLEDLFAHSESLLLQSESALTPFLEDFTQVVLTHLVKMEDKIVRRRFSSSLPTKLLQLNERQREILRYLESPEVKITNHQVQTMFKVAQVTASRDLSRLAGLGLLFAYGKGRSIYYTKV